jgi:PAS domain S-box-containing protein
MTPEGDERLRQVIRQLEETNRTQQLVMEASRDMLLARDEAEVVELFGRSVKRLLPERYFCVRVVDPKTLTLTSHFWEGPAPPKDLEVLRLKRSAIKKMRLSEDLQQHPQAEVLDHYQPIFEGTREGLAMPLVAAGDLFGLLNLEYPPGVPAHREEDGILLRPLVNQISLILRNRRLLHESQRLRAYLEKLVEGANALIVVLDRNRQVLFFNRELEKLTGRRKEEVLGTNFLQLLPTEERTRFLRVLINSMRGEPTSNFETRIRAKNGTEIKVAINSAAILTPEGEVEAVVAIGQDLTKLKDLEQQVIQAERLATVGQLAAGVVHELNNPLTSITVYGEYLQKKFLTEGSDPADVDKARKIVEGAERIRHFTRDLMSYARPAGSRLSELQLNDVVRQAISFCEHLVKSANAQLEIRLQAELPRVVGAPGQLQQVFINLMANACDAVADAGGGRIEVWSEPVDEMVTVSIRDDGPGIPEGDLSHIFEPFFTSKPPGKGTGLGLSIVKEILDSHGGRVVVESTSGRGSLFRVEVPTARRRAGGKVA